MIKASIICLAIALVFRVALMVEPCVFAVIVSAICLVVNLVAWTYFVIHVSRLPGGHGG
jgi:hypothetical protein